MLRYFATHKIFRVIKTKDLNKLIFCLRHISSKVDISQKIEKIQKFFTRIALKRCNIAARSYDERLEICKLKQLNDRRDITDLCMTFKFITGRTHLKPEKFFVFAKRKKKIFNTE